MLMSEREIYMKEIFRPVAKNFERQRVKTSYVGDILAIDLVEIKNLGRLVKEYKFLLTCIDIYSKYVWVIPLKTKSAEEVLNGFKQIDCKTITNLWSDEGKEFYNSIFKKYCKERNINLYHTYSGMKSVFIERFNRTLKEMIYKYVALNKNDDVIGLLSKIVKTYNGVKHKSTGKKPKDIFNGKERPVMKRDIIVDEEPKFKKGDLVRISKIKGVFSKGYSQRWSDEVFKIDKVKTGYPYLYLIKDMLDEEITGSFYEKELMLTKVPNFKTVEEVVKKKKGYVKVRYTGLDSKFDEWLSVRKFNKLMKT